MKFLKFIIIASILLGGVGFNENVKNDLSTEVERIEQSSKKIQVLNLGTFHFGYTSDANTTNFDEKNKENQRQAHEIAEKLAKFQPTVILVEMPPEKNGQLQSDYQAYVKNPKMSFKSPTEIELLAFELGRISGVKKIYGVDHKLSYNYAIGMKIENAIDSTLHNQYFKNPYSFHPELPGIENNPSLLQRLKQINHDKFLDFLITVNADILTHAGTSEGFEGADEAAKYYQRNLRMYSNINRLELSKDDRVFILMGASHSAFFRDFMSRSPKYEMVDTFQYLK